MVEAEHRSIDIQSAKDFWICVKDDPKIDEEIKREAWDRYLEMVQPRKRAKLLDITQQQAPSNTLTSCEAPSASAAHSI